MTRDEMVSALSRLRLATPRLRLRLPVVAEIRELGILAKEGVHRPEQMPFLVPWTDLVESPAFIEDFVDYHLAQREQWGHSHWNLELAVWAGSELIGIQAVEATCFRDRRQVSTGSWLGERFQRRGFGTEMRAAILALSFDGIGAVEAQTGAFTDNVASATVSLRLGYRELTPEHRENRGVQVPHRRFALSRSHWERTGRQRTTIIGAEDCREAFDAPGLGVPNWHSVGQQNDVDRFLADLITMARARPDVRAVALVGSHAHGTARADSDVDVVILTVTPESYLERDGWINGLAGATHLLTRRWGVLTERRLVLQSGTEIDFGVARPSWADVVPVDPGTARVAGDGLVVLHDPDGRLVRLRLALS